MKRTKAQQKADKKYNLKRRNQPLLQCRLSEEENELFKSVHAHFKLTKKETIIKAIRLLKSTI
jgi:hypothetical protein